MRVSVSHSCEWLIFLQDRFEVRYCLVQVEGFQVKKLGYLDEEEQYGVE